MEWTLGKKHALSVLAFFGFLSAVHATEVTRQYPKDLA